ncbi:MAG: bifunctional ornithine acetyltransferase/N-acetylglutamate synthase, partial [Terriglobia bacterium]
MSEVVDLEGGITRPAGFTAAGVACGIKESGNRDLSLVHSAVPARSAAVFTASDLWGAPLVVSRRHLQNGVAQAVVANSGCANTCTGSPGEDDAVRMAQVAGSSLGISPYDVIVASTGLIGSRLPMDRIERGIEAAVNDLGEKGHLAAAEGILTTDTAVKEAACGFSMGDSEIGVGGMAKGAGMIGPKMSAGARGPGEATMLAFITTDALVDPGFLQECLGRAVDN